MYDLWVAIEFAVHRRYWEITSILSKVPAEVLQYASYQLIVKIIGHWVHRGRSEVDSELTLSVKSTLKDFQ